MHEALVWGWGWGRVGCTYPSLTQTCTHNVIVRQPYRWESEKVNVVLLTQLLDFNHLG